jgi:hypothetical protein
LPIRPDGDSSAGEIHRRSWTLARDVEWRLIFALCRFGGLRCPSEIPALRWRILIGTETDQRGIPQETPANGVMPDDSDACKSLQDNNLETKGIEPSFRRCDRRVLPLHHVPRTTFDWHFTACRQKVNYHLSSSGGIT